MKNNFRILWFDDQVEWQRGEQKDLQTEFLKKYLTLEVTFHKNTDNFKEESFQSCKYDLILLDYDLGNGITGIDIITLIRNFDVLTDIILYSGHIDRLMEAIKSNDYLEGIYTSHKETEQFQDKVMRVTEKIIARSENIINLRGFVLNNTCDFESRIVDLLNVAAIKINQNTSLAKTMTLDTCVSLSERKKEIDDFVKKLDSNTGWEKLLNKRYYLEQKQKMILLELFVSSTEDFASIPECKSICNLYYDEIGYIRNQLAHKPIQEDFIEVNGQDVTIDSTLFFEMRKRIYNFDSLIEKMTTIAYEISKKT